MDSSNQVPNGDTFGRFRNLLDSARLAGAAFLSGRFDADGTRADPKKGTIVDSTIISAPCSTKNKEKKRDPDAHQTKKEIHGILNIRHKSELTRTAALYTVKATPANVHNVTVVPQLMTDEEEVVYGDSGYIGAEKREEAIVLNSKGKKVRYQVNRSPSQIKKLSKSGQYKAKKRECAKSSVRAKVEQSSASLSVFLSLRRLGTEVCENRLKNSILCSRLRI